MLNKMWSKSVEPIQPDALSCKMFGRALYQGVPWSCIEMHMHQISFCKSQDFAIVGGSLDSINRHS